LHPEFKSKPLDPHPLFREPIEASYNNRVERLKDHSVSEHALQ
jgi:CTP synthase